MYVSATPTNLALRGTGSTGHPEASTVIFRVLDQAGGPRVGTTVNFSLNTTVGGISVQPATAQRNSKKGLRAYQNDGLYLVYNKRTECELSQFDKHSEQCSRV